MNDIALKTNLVADGDGNASWVVGRVGFSAIVTLIAIKPVGNVNAASRGAASLSLSGRTLTSDVDISNAAPLMSLDTGTHFTISSSDRLTVSISGASENDQFRAIVHAVPIT